MIARHAEEVQQALDRTRARYEAERSVFRHLLDQLAAEHVQTLLGDLVQAVAEVSGGKLNVWTESRVKPTTIPVYGMPDVIDRALQMADANAVQRTTTVALIARRGGKSSDSEGPSFKRIVLVVDISSVVPR